MIEELQDLDSEMWSETTPGAIPIKKPGRTLLHLSREICLHFSPPQSCCSGLTSVWGEKVCGPFSLGHGRGNVLILFVPFHFSPTFCFLPVLSVPVARPTKDDSKESDFWKMIHESEDQVQGGEEAQVEVRDSFLVISLMKLN